MAWSPRFRLALAAGLFSTWMVLLLTGFALGGAVHLLLFAALVCFPWRSSSADSETTPTSAEDSRRSD